MGRGTQVVHAARRPAAARASAAEPGTAAERRGRRHQEVSFRGRPGRGGHRGMSERHVAQARAGRRRRRSGGRGRAERALVGSGRGRREQAARPPFLELAGRHEQRAVAAAKGRGRGLHRRGARQTALGRGRADRHRQHGPAGARRPALVLHQRLDVGRGLGLARPPGHQRAMARGRRAARARQRAAAREHRVLPGPDLLQRPVRRLDRLENSRRLQAAVHVELGKRRAVLKHDGKTHFTHGYYV